MKSVVTVSFLLLLVSESLAQTTYLVRHSQTDTPPACPAGWTRLWIGYSFMRTGIWDDFSSPQDLGKPGSCLEQFVPVPGNRCTVPYCLGDNTVQVSGQWLVTERYQNESPLNTSSGMGTTDILAKISRCSVCEGPVPVITRHSYSPTVPACPTGWSSLWSGYSFGGAAEFYGKDAGVDLGGTGSCLQNFIPLPVIQCEYSKCDYYTSGYNQAQWMLNSDTFGDADSRPNGSAAQRAVNANRVGRCNVCAMQ